MRAALVAVVLSTVAWGGTKFVGGGLEVGPTAPVLLPVANPGDKVHVSQILYTQAELGFAANTHLIDVAWRKEGLGPVTGAGGCAEQVYLKNVTRQMGPFTAGSTQPLADALMNAQKVIDKPASMLPNTMGFVTLDVLENQFDFVYLGDGLEVTIITDCRGATAPVVDGPVRWRYDVVPERVRVASGATTDGLTLTAEPVLSSFRPHTRFRTLVETPGIEIKVSTNALPNGGAFGVAPKHFAAGVVAPFRFIVVNPSIVPLTINSIVFSNQMNGTASTTVTTPLTVMRGQEVATPVDFTPAAPGTLARLTVTWNTSAGTWTNTFQGMPTATEESQPAGGLERPDGTVQALTAGAPPLMVPVGSVPPAHEFEQTLIASNYGHLEVEAHCDVVSGDAQVVTPPVMVGTQQDVRLLTRSRAPVTAGPFTIEKRLVVGGQTYLVLEVGTVAAPDLRVSVGGTEITPGAMETISRPDAAPLTHTYRLENVGSLPLVFASGLDLTTQADDQLTAMPLRRVLGVGEAVDVTFTLPAWAPALEPFALSTITNDPERTFAWTATTQLPVRPGKQLTVTVRTENDGTSSGVTVDVKQGDYLEVPRTRGLTLTVANTGSEVVTVSGLTERCRGCASAPAPATPIVLEPGAVYERSVGFTGEWHLEYLIESDAEGSPLHFDVDGLTPGCAMAPGPLLVGLVALWVARRARRASRPV